MTNQKLTWGAAIICIAFFTAAMASAQPARISSSVISSGGGVASAGTMIMSGTIGQAVIGPSTAATLKAFQGFWYTLPVEATGPTSVPVTPGLAEGAFLQSWPNPFSHESELQVRIPTSGPVSLKLYNALGREVRTLIDGEREAGVISIRLDGATLESGSYTAQLIAGATRHAIKLVVVK